MTPRSAPFATMASRLFDARFYLNGIDASLALVNRHLGDAPNQRAKISSILGQGGIGLRVSERKTFSNRLRRISDQYAFSTAHEALCGYLAAVMHELAETAIADGEPVVPAVDDDRPRVLLDRVQAAAGVTVPDEILRPALMMIDIHRLIVHNGRYLDVAFLERFGDLYLADAPVGARLNIAKGSARDALWAAEALALHLDTELLAQGLLAPVQRPASPPNEDATDT